MKVLFVEDELAQNIHRIINIFSGVLQKSQKDALLAFEKRDYGATDDEVKCILERSGTLHVEYTFPGAVRRLCESSWDYELLVVDRQLSKDGNYDVAAVRESDPGFDGDKQVKYVEREGDYLLVLAYKRHPEWAKRFYFLTAYAHEETIRSMAELQGVLDLGVFTREQLIEKGSREAEDRLGLVVAKCEQTRLRLALAPYLDGAEHLLKEEVLRECVTYLKDDGVNTTLARPLVENIVKALCIKIGRGAPYDTFQEMTRRVYYTCIDCSLRKGRPSECVVPTNAYLPEHIEQTRGWFRSAEVGAAMCVNEAGSMKQHHLAESVTDVRPMLLYAVKTILRRLTLLHQQGLF
jgi:hypothetical protein